MLPIIQNLAKENKTEIIYPDSDGKHMADNTLQFKLIVLLVTGLSALYDDENVFVAGDLLWYPIEGNPKKCVAPDCLVAIGRPRKDRGSYKQWEEENIPPQVVFEVLSPSNTHAEMAQKAMFYDKFGVEEYYVLDPEKPYFEVWIRYDKDLELIDSKQTMWTSKLLGIKLVIIDEKLRIFNPNGSRFLTYTESLKAKAIEIEARQKAEAEQQKAEAENLKLLTLLKNLGIDPKTGQKIG